MTKIALFLGSKNITNAQFAGMNLKLMIKIMREKSNNKNSKFQMLIRDLPKWKINEMPSCKLNFISLSINVSITY